MPGVDVLASIFNGANAAYMADLYARWVNNLKRLIRLR